MQMVALAVVPRTRDDAPGWGNTWKNNDASRTARMPMTSIRERLAAKPWYKWYALGVLTVVFTASHGDRQPTPHCRAHIGIDRLPGGPRHKEKGPRRRGVRRRG